MGVFLMGEQKIQPNPWKKFNGPNLGYVIGQYELYINGLDTVDSELKELFIKYITVS